MPDETAAGGTATGATGTTTRQPALRGEFTVERELAAPPGRVFAAYAQTDLRRRWFRNPGDPRGENHELDFRVGGRESSRGRFAPSGVPGSEELIEYRAVFWDIVPDERIVYGYELVLNGIRRWVSLVTVELSALPDELSALPDELSALPDGTLTPEKPPTRMPSGIPGTRLKYTEQYLYLAYAGDGTQDLAHLRGSVPLQLNGLAAALSD